MWKVDTPSAAAALQAHALRVYNANGINPNIPEWSEYTACTRVSTQTANARASLRRPAKAADNDSKPSDKRPPLILNAGAAWDGRDVALRGAPTDKSN